MKTYVIPALEDLVRMSYPGAPSGKQRLRYTDGSFSATGEELSNQKFFDPSRFQQFIVSSHCEENLNFLIDIMRYEEAYRGRKITEDDPGILSCRSMRIKPCPIDPDCTDVGVTGSTASTDGLERIQQDRATDTGLDDIKDGLEGLSMSDNGGGPESGPNGSVTDDLWRRIIDQYIKPGSPQELNLPEEVVTSLLAEDQKSHRHPPSVLLKAKKMVLSLLRQNVYWTFIRDAESKVEQDSGKTGSNAASTVKSRRGPAGVMFTGTSEGVMTPDGQPAAAVAPPLSRDSSESGSLSSRGRPHHRDEQRATGFLRFYNKQQHVLEDGYMFGLGKLLRKKSSPSRSRSSSTTH